MPINISYPLPPQAGEIELRVIAALTHIGDPFELNVQQAMLALDSECFYNSAYRQMFVILENLFKQESEFSFITFITLLPDELYNIATDLIKDEYVSINYLASDVEQLISYRGLRKQLRILIDAANVGLNAFTANEGLIAISDKLQLITQSSSTTRKSYLRSYATIADEFLMEEGDDTSEIHVDIPNLPPILNRSLITIAGRSGHGKTFFAMYLMDKIIDAQVGRQTLYFNLEMHERVMLERHAKLLGIKGYTRKETIANGLAQLLAKNVSLISEQMITIDEIETESRLASLRQPIAVIVVDYLGLIRSKSKSERKDLEQGDIAKRLAALSIELDCVVIALIQVNRDFKTRPVGERCPRVEDSAESMGSVHSSTWWLGIDQPQKDNEDSQWKDMFMVECRKNRGESGNFKLQLKFQGGTFSRWTQPFCSSYSAPKNLIPEF